MLTSSAQEQSRELEALARSLVARLSLDGAESRPIMSLSSASMILRLAQSLAESFRKA